MCQPQATKKGELYFEIEHFNFNLKLYFEESTDVVFSCMRQKASDWSSRTTDGLQELLEKGGEATEHFLRTNHSSY